MNPEFFSDFNGAMDALDADFEPDLPVILTAKRVFSAGLDLKYVTNSIKTEEDARDYVKKFNTAMERWYLLNRPTCASLYGSAVGGGLVLALACDYRTANQNNKEAFVEMSGVLLGLTIPSVAFEIVKQNVRRPYPLAEVLLRGDRYSFEEAFEEGLITSGAETDEDVERCATDLLAATSTKNTHEPFVFMKRLLKEKGILTSRESGEAHKRDELLIKQLHVRKTHMRILNYMIDAPVEIPLK